MSDSDAIPIIQSTSEGAAGGAGGGSALTNSRTSLKIIEKHGDNWQGATKGDLFTYITEGAYKLNDPVLQSDHGSAYSVDMVRYEIEYENAEKFCQCIDTCPLFNIVNTYTSNRIGTYRYMWAINYADGEQGGGEFTLENGDTYVDGNKSTVIKIGFGVVSSGGMKKKGFIEFNPNKCLPMGSAIMSRLYDQGCDFELKRWDLAIDYGVERTSLRVLKDRRKYEFHVSNGITEYLGRRNAPGRVKVYDKAAEQELDDAHITRVEITCDASWNEKQIKDHLPKVYAPMRIDLNATHNEVSALVNVLLDVMGYTEYFQEYDVPFIPVPEKYFAMLERNRRTRVKGYLSKHAELLPYDVACIALVKAKAEKIGRLLDECGNWNRSETTEFNWDAWNKFVAEKLDAGSF